VPASPYSNLDRPPLNAHALRRALLVPDGVWTRLELRAETDSTNGDAVAAARAGEPEGLIVVAERQRAGRGRHGRTWTSPARAGIAVSVLLRPGTPSPERGWAPVPPARYGWLPLLAGVALAEAVRRVAEVDAVLKWPNDLLVPLGAGNGSGGGHGKCAGILAESATGDPAAGGIVVGIGLNVTLRADELPPAPGGPTAALPATSLQLAGAPATDRDPLLRATLRGLADWYTRWRSVTGDPEGSGLREAYELVCATVDARVRVMLPAGAELVGTATGVDGDGRLMVRTADGEHAIAAGDVVHVR
jgi:BirA family biotin operon repressor/biotin-[acetyl-CoA-carboxylase] ligase